MPPVVECPQTIGYFSFIGSAFRRLYTYATEAVLAAILGQKPPGLNQSLRKDLWLVFTVTYGLVTGFLFTWLTSHVGSCGNASAFGAVTLMESLRILLLRHPVNTLGHWLLCAAPISACCMALFLQLFGVENSMERIKKRNCTHGDDVKCPYDLGWDTRLLIYKMASQR